MRNVAHFTVRTTSRTSRKQALRYVFGAILPTSRKMPEMADFRAFCLRELGESALRIRVRYAALG